MMLLVIGLVLFLGIHLLPTQSEMRNGLVARFGESAYKGLFAAVSLLGFALIVIGYHKLQLAPGKNPQLWSPPDWTRHVAFLLMLPVFILLIAAYVPSRIRDATKHPMLLAIKLWALAHLLVNGDLGSLLLFGGFLAYAAYDRVSVRKRGARGPLGDARPGKYNDFLVVMAGLAFYAFMLVWGHELLIGVPLLAHG